MITNIIALYPGRFQPFGKHHAASFKWLESEFGGANCYIVTTNITSLPRGLKVESYIELNGTKLTGYSDDELRKMVKPGYIKGRIIKF
jgi:hypothetical protein